MYILLADVECSKLIRRETSKIFQCGWGDHTEPYKKSSMLILKMPIHIFIHIQKISKV